MGDPLLACMNVRNEVLHERPFSAGLYGMDKTEVLHERPCCCWCVRNGNEVLRERPFSDGLYEMENEVLHERPFGGLYEFQERSHTASTLFFCSVLDVQNRSPT